MRLFVTTLFATLGGAQVLSLNTGPGPYEYPPMIGFGTWQMYKENATEAVAKAIEQGYRHIDAAYIYFNQPAVGEGIRQGMKRANITRKDLWVTSKLWNSRYIIILGL
jgi:alcohol dehydrogenase (NADP+)